MPDAQAVADHYTHGTLIDAIRRALGQIGKTPRTVAVDDLAPVDEFHIGGRSASEAFLGLLELVPDDHVLDVGCGLGGASRFVAQRYGSRVTGIDLTQEYVETGRILCSWVGLEDRIMLDQGNASATSYLDGAFDKTFLMHVGMNIADKRALMAELHRVLRPGGRLGIYDVMRVGKGDLAFPVPWASAADGSAVAAPDEYRDCLQAAGFRVTAERDRRDFALEFFQALQARTAAAGGPPPLGLHVLMGSSAPLKVKNMIDNISAGRIAPVEIIASKAP